MYLVPHPSGHTHPWVRRVFRNRACGSRAGRHAGGRKGLARGPQTPRPTPPGGFLLVHAPASLPESPQASKAMTSPLTWSWVARRGRQRDATEPMHTHEPPLWPPGGSTHRPARLSPPEPRAPLPGPSRSACTTPERNCAHPSPPRARQESASSHSAHSAGTAGASPCRETSPSRLGKGRM